MEEMLDHIKELKLTVINELKETRDVVSKMKEKIDTMKMEKEGIVRYLVIFLAQPHKHTHIYIYNLSFCLVPLP